jgi:hypothetical protein
MSNKTLGSNQDTGQLPASPRLSWRAKLGLRPGKDGSSHQSRSEYSTSKNHTYERSDQSNSTESVQPIAALGTQAESKAQVRSSFAAHGTAAKLQSQYELQETDGGILETETEVNPQAQFVKSEEDDKIVDNGEMASGPNRMEDFWAIAREQLQQDHDKTKIINRFDHILEKPENVGSAFEHAGTEARRKQIETFFHSKSQKLVTAGDQNRLNRCKNKTKNFFKSAVSCVTTTQHIISAALIPGLPASAACAGLTVLLNVSLFAMGDIAIVTLLRCALMKSINTRICSKDLTALLAPFIVLLSMKISFATPKTGVLQMLRSRVFSSQYAATLLSSRHEPLVTWIKVY